MQKELEQSACFVCVISTHGGEAGKAVTGSGKSEYKHKLLGIHNGKVDTGWMIKLFADVKELKGKPKLFFLQVNV